MMRASLLLANGRMGKPLTAKVVAPAAGNIFRKFLLFMCLFFLPAEAQRRRFTHLRCASAD
jgi:hypothetical protein